MENTIVAYKIRLISFIVITLLFTFCLASQVNAADPFLVKKINGDNGYWVDHLVNFNDKLYFQGYDDAHGYELWVTDGTNPGTYIVKDVNPGVGYSYPEKLTVSNGKLFFAADDGVNGTVLWASDGTESGTYMVKNVIVGNTGLYPDDFESFNSKLYFAGDNGVNGYELWVTDGTDLGTGMVKDIRIGALDSDPSQLGVYNDKLYFVANNGIHHNELWVSDGTEGGTSLVKDIRTGNLTSYPDHMTAYNGEVYFEARDDTHGNELWVTDGTEGGTSMIKDIFSGASHAYPDYLTVYNGSLYFSAKDNASWCKFWKTDGTEIGTVIVKDVCPGVTNYTMYYLTTFNNKLYFPVRDALGMYLFTSDGTDQGTELVKDGIEEPHYLTVFNNLIYFSAYDATHNYELWVSDGTTPGTAFLFDINPGVSESEIDDVTLSNNRLFFRAYDDVSGYNLWAVDASSSLTPTPTLTPTTAPATTSTGSVAGTSTGISTPPNDSPPTGAPDLFQIDTTCNSAKLYFAPASGSVTSYSILYGLKETDLSFGVNFAQGYSSGVLNYSVNSLSSNEKYYFKIQALNGGMSGSWSSVKMAKTGSKCISITPTPTPKEKNKDRTADVLTPTSTPVPTPTEAPNKEKKNPFTPKVVTPSCLSGPSSSTDIIDISWINNEDGAKPVKYVDISTDSDFGILFNLDTGKDNKENKVTGPKGFKRYRGSSDLIIYPDTQYYVRLYNGRHSKTTSFYIPSCSGGVFPPHIEPSLTPSLTPTPRPKAKVIPTLQPRLTLAPTISIPEETPTAGISATVTPEPITPGVDPYHDLVEIIVDRMTFEGGDGEDQTSVIDEIYDVLDTVTDTLGAIAEPISNTVNRVIENALVTLPERTQEALVSGMEQLRTSLASILLERTGVAVAVTTSLLLAPQAASTVYSSYTLIQEIPLYLSRLFFLILHFFGIRRKERPWGVVYDSLTKQPVDPVLVTLTPIDKDSSQSEETRINDFEGRFGFLVNPGKYLLNTVKKDYVFPSKVLWGQDADGDREHLYFGEELQIDHPDLINVSIPVDPAGFNWNQANKPVQYRSPSLLSKIFRSTAAHNLTYLGLGISILSYFLNPTAFNILMVLIYLVFIIIRIFLLKVRKWGVVYNSRSNDVLPLVTVRGLRENGVSDGNCLTDDLGRYYLILNEGIHTLQVEQKADDGTISVIKKFGPVRVRRNNSVISPNIEV